MFMKWVQQMIRPHIYNLSNRNMIPRHSWDQYKVYSRDGDTGEASRHCRNHESSFNIYMESNKIHNVVLMSKFYSALYLDRHVSDLIGPSSGAFCTSCIHRLWYVVLLCVLLHTYYHIPKSVHTACTKRSWWRTDKVRNMSSWMKCWIKLTH